MSCERVIVDPDEVDAAHVAGCAECQAQLAAVRRITHAMRDTGAQAKRKPDHLARVWAAVERPPRRRWVPYAGAGTVLVAAAAVLVLWLRPKPPAAPRFDVDFVAGTGEPIRGDAKLGDRMRVHAREGKAIAVRVYANDRKLLLDCPRECRRSDGAMVGEVTLEIAKYQVLWIKGAVPAPTGSLDGDIAAIKAVGAQHELLELEVR